MRIFVAAAAATFALLAQANAGATITTRTEHYAISGKSGVELLRQMDRRGPKHGLLARAMAQTRYTLGWEMEWERQGKACRLANADARLSITYLYPKTTGSLPSDLKRRWKGFMAAVTQHEEAHGRMARQMAHAAHDAVAGLAIANDPGCAKARREARRRIERVVGTYEKRQLNFDASEHRDGGNVYRVVAMLIGKGN